MEAEPGEHAHIDSGNKKIILFREVLCLGRRFEIRICGRLEEDRQKTLAVHRRRSFPVVGVHAVPEGLHGNACDVPDIDERSFMCDWSESPAEIDDPELFGNLVIQLAHAQFGSLLLGPEGEHGIQSLGVTVHGDVTVCAAVGRCKIEALRIHGQGRNILRCLIQNAVYR